MRDKCQRREKEEWYFEVSTSIYIEELIRNHGELDINKNFHKKVHIRYSAGFYK